MRVFSEINATMSAVTGVPITNGNVRQTYRTVEQQLPSTEDIEGFLSAHQVGVSQLAIEYCNELVSSNGLRALYFPGFDFNASAASAFAGAANRDLIFDPLLVNMMNTGLATQPDFATVKQELDGLVDGLTACGAGCAPDRTQTVVKAVCAAVLGSAVTLLQ